MDILTALVPLIVPILLPLIIAASAAAYQFLVQRSPASVHQLVSSVASTVVQGTEQYYSGVQGDSKRLAAEKAINMTLAHMRVNVSPALVNAAIESAVYTMNQEQVLFAKPVNTEPTPATNTSAT